MARPGPGEGSGSRTMPEWGSVTVAGSPGREAVRERDDKRSTRAGARIVWVARSACGEAAGSAARDSGARAGEGIRPGGGRMREGTTQSGRPCKCAQKAVREEALGRAPRFDGKEGNADVKHNAVRLEAGRQRDEDKDK